MNEYYGHSYGSLIEEPQAEALPAIVEIYIIYAGTLYGEPRTLFMILLRNGAGYPKSVLPSERYSHCQIRAMSVQEYIEKHELSKRVEEVINATVKAKPDEPLSYMVSGTLC